MEALFNQILVFLVALTIILASKILAPQISYAVRFSLIVAILLSLYYVYLLINNFTFVSTISFLTCCYYIYRGGINLSLKTATLVFNNITKKVVGHLEAGQNWIDPIFEVATISADGIPNKTIDLQELEIEIPETKLMQTKTRGIQAKVKEISFMLQLHGDAQRLLEIEGGSKTVKNRIIRYVDEFFLEHVNQILPSDLDQDKRKIIEDLTRDLKRDVNHFCNSANNRYPYMITDDVIIGDTELEPKYYEVLAKAEFTKLEQDGLDVEAGRLKSRLLDLGNSLLPTGNEHQKLKAAMISLKITPQTFEEKTFGLSPEVSTLLKELADIIKK